MVEVNKDIARNFVERLKFALSNNIEGLGETFSDFFFTYDYRELEEKVIPISYLGYCELKSALRIALGVRTTNTKLVRGKMLHLAVEEIMKKVRELGYFDSSEVLIEDEALVSYEVWNGWRIVGYPDLVVGDTVIDFKFSSNVRNSKSYDHYKLQVNTYAYLLGKERGVILVFDVDDLERTRVIEVKTSQKLFDDAVKKATRIAMAVEELKSGRLPFSLDYGRVPEYKWECKFCDVIGACDEVMFRLMEKDVVRRPKREYLLQSI